jgi:tripeptidyl-peptidase-1
VLFSTGDSGVGSRDCETNDGRNVMQFQPSFPASCKPSPLLVYCTFGWLLVDALLRSLRYCRRSDNRCQPRDRRLLLWRRILKLLRSTFLSDRSRHGLHRELERHLRRALQVRSPFPRALRTAPERCGSPSFYSATGRGFPDVAARGDWYQVVVGNKTVHLDGTSASTPVRYPQAKSVRCVKLTLSVLL